MVLSKFNRLIDSKKPIGEKRPVFSMNINEYNIGNQIEDIGNQILGGNFYIM